MSLRNRIGLVHAETLEFLLIDAPSVIDRASLAGTAMGIFLAPDRLLDHNLVGGSHCEIRRVGAELKYMCHLSVVARKPDDSREGAGAFQMFPIDLKKAHSWPIRKIHYRV